MTDKVAKEGAWSEANEREYKINKTSLKQGHLKSLHVSKEGPTKHNYGKTTPDLFWEINMTGCLSEVSVQQCMQHEE